MFQNISGEIDQEIENEEIKFNKKVNIKTFITNAFTKQKVILYIVAFMLSTIECGNNIAPFAIAIFAASCSNKIPTAIIYVMTLIGTFVGLGQAATLTYILTSLIFIVMILLIRKNKIEGDYENEKRRLGIYVFLSSFLVQVVNIFFMNFMIYDVLASLLSGISAFIFYKIFTNSIIVINEYKIKKVFAIEEVIGASIMLAICASALREFSIFGFEVRTILSILIVLILGWKNGILVGATTGITIGTVLGLIGQGESIMIASYALSGMLAGIFSKFGRVGVIVGFILGNTILTYATNGNTNQIIYFKEILIASLGLLLMPRDISLNIEELFNKNKLLPVGVTNVIQGNKDTILKLNNVSEAISEIADTYKEVAATVIEEEDLVEERNKELFLKELSDSIEELEENILYEDILDENSAIVTDIFRTLLKEQKITRKDILNIFGDHNNYIIGFDDAKISMKIEKDIRIMVDAINEAYKMCKAKFIWQQKIDENKRNIKNQLDGVSKVISSIANDMEEKNKKQFLKEKEEILAICATKSIDLKDVIIERQKTGRYIITTYMETCDNTKKEECSIDQVEKILSKVLEEDIEIQKYQCGVKQNNNLCITTFVSQDRYLLQLGISKATKENSSVSGDSSTSIKLNDGKYLLAISDGMGSGPKARQSSQIAIKMLERLLTTGFDKDTSIELINSTLSVNSEEDAFATLDIAILDLYTGNIEFIKNGACPTYLKHNRKVEIIKALSLPAGILENISLIVYDKDIEDNDIVVMCSDGIMESNTEYQNRELWVRDILETIETDNVQKIADIITKEAIDNGYGIAKDDMTIMVAKFTKK
ncbi:MAG: SpoIIE family protein phosphatase [Clostridia bacterium]|nr:SpoIIE family protein phosphatase [Clostridia bacterium]